MNSIYLYLITLINSRIFYNSIKYIRNVNPALLYIIFMNEFLIYLSKKINHISLFLCLCLIINTIFLMLTNNHIYIFVYIILLIANSIINAYKITATKKIKNFQFGSKKFEFILYIFFLKNNIYKFNKENFIILYKTYHSKLRTF